MSCEVSAKHGSSHPVIPQRNPYKVGKYVGIALGILGAGVIIGGACLGRFGASSLSESLINRVVPILVGTGTGIFLFSIPVMAAFWSRSSEWDEAQKK